MNVVDDIAEIAEVNSDNNTIIKSYISQNKEYIAYYFSRDVGATEEKSFQLSIYQNGEELNNKTGNIFISYDPFDFQWKNDEAVVSYDKSDRILYKQKSMKI